MIPNLVEPGWSRIERLGAINGPALLHYDDGTVRVAHVCDRGERGKVRCAPALQLDGGHTIEVDDKGRSTVTPSIACPDCGLHGFATEGQWLPA